MSVKPGKLLAGDDLLQSHIYVDRTLPKSGVKEFKPTGSWLEKKQIQTILDEQKQLLEEERVEKLGALAEAYWNPKRKLAEVTKKVGKYWQTMGFEVGGKLFLYPEEALHLLEMNCIELTYDGVPLSIQQAYSILLSGTGCTLKEYRTYSHLTKQGYRLLRHNRTNLPTRYEHRIRLDQHTSRERVFVDLEPANPVSISETSLQTTSEDLVSLVKDEANNPDEQDSENNQEPQRYTEQSSTDSQDKSNRPNQGSHVSDDSSRLDGQSHVKKERDEGSTPDINNQPGTSLKQEENSSGPMTEFAQSIVDMGNSLIKSEKTANDEELVLENLRKKILDMLEKHFQGRVSQDAMNAVSDRASEAILDQVCNEDARERRSNNETLKTNTDESMNKEKNNEDLSSGLTDLTDKNNSSNYSKPISDHVLVDCLMDEGEPSPVDSIEEAVCHTAEDSLSLLEQSDNFQSTFKEISGNMESVAGKATHNTVQRQKEGTANEDSQSEETANNCDIPMGESKFRLSNDGIQRKQVEIEKHGENKGDENKFIKSRKDTKDSAEDDNRRGKEDKKIEEEERRRMEENERGEENEDRREEDREKSKEEIREEEGERSEKDTGEQKEKGSGDGRGGEEDKRSKESERMEEDKNKEDKREEGDGRKEKEIIEAAGEKSREDGKEGTQMEENMAPTEGVRVEADTNQQDMSLVEDNATERTDNANEECACTENARVEGETGQEGMCLVENNATERICNVTQNEEETIARTEEAKAEGETDQQDMSLNGDNATQHTVNKKQNEEETMARTEEARVEGETDQEDMSFDADNTTEHSDNKKQNEEETTARTEEARVEGEPGQQDMSLDGDNATERIDNAPQSATPSGDGVENNKTQLTTKDLEGGGSNTSADSVSEDESEESLEYEVFGNRLKDSEHEETNEVFSVDDDIVEIEVSHSWKNVKAEKPASIKNKRRKRRFADSNGWGSLKKSQKDGAPQKKLKVSDEVDIIAIPPKSSVELIDLSDDDCAEILPKLEQTCKKEIEIVDLDESDGSSSSDGWEKKSKKNIKKEIKLPKLPSAFERAVDSERKAILELFPNMINKQVMTFQVPDKQYLPPNINPVQPSYIVGRRGLYLDRVYKPQRHLMRRPFYPNSRFNPYGDFSGAPRLNHPRQLNIRPRFNAPMNTPMWQQLPMLQNANISITPMQAFQMITSIVLPMFGIAPTGNPFMGQRMAQPDNMRWNQNQTWQPRRNMAWQSQQPWRSNYRAPPWNNHSHNQSRPWQNRSNQLDQEEVPERPKRPAPEQTPVPMQGQAPVSTQTPDFHPVPGPTGPTKIRWIGDKGSRVDSEAVRVISGRPKRPFSFNPSLKRKTSRDYLTDIEDEIRWKKIQRINEISDSGSSDSELDVTITPVNKSQSSTTELKPLLRMDQCADAASIMASLQVISRVNLEALDVCGDCPFLKISFDMYQPGAPFKKSSPPTPAFRLCIMGVDEPVPSPGEIAILLDGIHDDVPLLLAVVHPDDISFFLYAGVDIPKQVFSS